MEATRLAPSVGIVASALVLFVLTIPYALVDAGSAVATYYASGAVNPLVVGLFALVAVMVFAAGRQGRSPPDLVAGAALVLGLFMFVISLLWAVTLPGNPLLEFSMSTILEYHRTALVLTSLGVPVSAVWYARALRIF
ncbi:hypothetical protein SAMN05216559_3465 [Halomicrobium zhouii]|uniref:Uncharacterized protein n=1 Tax=Halomicrobium zhouii TaxID=767519 RepID=A0A1I6LZ80_9EURY|nr:hypothetical protein [Halomicrobium zhouii]SFS08592.1 hypothetical protein SAMN05216559_3465 [Halomicrobium zhouii]